MFMLFPSKNPIFIVVLPLVELMDDQIWEASKLMITAMQIDIHAASDVQGHCLQVAYSTNTHGEHSFPAPIHWNHFQQLEDQTDT